jgi:hypothetical protein
MPKNTPASHLVFGQLPSMPPPETGRRPNQAGRDGAFAAWESTIKPARAIVGPAAVARKMGLAQRTARTWAAGERRPEKPREVARLLVALAREAALGFSADEHLRAEEIRGELPERVERSNASPPS